MNPENKPEEWYGVRYENKSLGVEESYHATYCNFYNKGEELDYSRKGKKGKKVGETDKIFIGQRDHRIQVSYDLVVFEGDNSVSQVLGTMTSDPEPWDK